MYALILSTLLAGQPVSQPVWRADAAGTADLGLWQGGRFLGRWVAAKSHYLPYDGKAYGPPCALPPDAPTRQRAFYAPQYPLMLGGCSGGRCR